MTLDERIKETEQKFSKLEDQRQEIITEQQRIQGEYRLLLVLQSEESSNQVANTIVAKPQKEKK